MHRDSVDEAQNSSQGIAFDLKEDRFATVGDNGSTDSIEKVVVTEQNSKAPGQDRDIVSSPNIRKNDEVLIRASPLSGRTHQIRLHCHITQSPVPNAKMSREELQAITLTPSQLQSERGRPHSQSERMRIGFGNGELGVGFWRDKSPGGGARGFHACPHLVNNLFFFLFYFSFILLI
jgi:hypothetical protein